MLNDITLGQFFPGNSVLHRIDPRIKIILSILYIVTIFLARSLASFAVLVLSALLLVMLSGISPKVVLKSLKPLLFIILFTVVINVFYTKSGTLLLEFYFIKIYSGGLLQALFMMIRIVCLLIGSSVILTYTTSPMALTDAMERLLLPLKIFKVPVHEFAMIMTIALRFIPTLIDETNKIMNAQRARGSDFSSGGLLTRAKALIPVLIPLLISAFRRAEELATAMECRCYHGGEGRTRFRVLSIGVVDVLAVCMMLVLGIITVLFNIYIGGPSI